MADSIDSLSAAIERFQKSYSNTQQKEDTYKDRLDEIVLEEIRQGIYTPDYKNMQLQLCIQRLRKRGLIDNQGTRKFPEWVVAK